MGKTRGGGARNDFERADFRQSRQDLILDALGQERVFLVAAKIFKWQDRDRLSRQGGRGAALIFLIRTDSFPRRQDPHRQTMRGVAAEKKQTGQEDRADDDHVDPDFAARMLIGGIGRFGWFDSFRRELEQPCETGGNGKTENDQEDEKSNGRNRNVKHRKNLGDPLSEGPPADEVGGSNLMNVAPL